MLARRDHLAEAASLLSSPRRSDHCLSPHLLPHSTHDEDCCRPCSAPVLYSSCQQSAPRRLLAGYDGTVQRRASPDQSTDCIVVSPFLRLFFLTTDCRSGQVLVCHLCGDKRFRASRSFVDWLSRRYLLGSNTQSQPRTGQQCRHLTLPSWWKR